MTTRKLVLVLAAASVLAAAGCGKSAKKAHVVARPQIVQFDGPSAVPCGKKGQIQSVSFTYVVRNANAVEPSVDHQAIGAQAGYNPRHGRMRFPYVCPGPHTVAISAFGKGGKSVSRSARLSRSRAAK